MNRGPLSPPVAAIRPHEVHSPHGVRVDDYYWLRDDTRTAPDVLEYLHAEDAYRVAMTAAWKPLEDQLAKVEMEYAQARGHGSVMEIAKTIFESRPVSENNYQFVVIEQRYRSVPK